MKMSDTKTAKKETSKPAKSEKTETKSADSKSEKKNEAKSETKSETKSENKSASQSSISHFSSVATDEYRSGWANIFSNNKTAKKAKSKKADSVSLPASFEILDEDIKGELRAVLYKAFQKQARKEGGSLAQLKKIGTIEYRLECDVSEKSD
jgi:hypothetical protein